MSKRVSNKKHGGGARSGRIRYGWSRKLTLEQKRADHVQRKALSASAAARSVKQRKVPTRFARVKQFMGRLAGRT